MPSRAIRSLLLLLFASTLVAASEARAGCGCTKPPPPASVRPAFAWPGAAVTLFDSALVPGHVYEVLFDPMQGKRRPGARGRGGRAP